MLWLQVQLVTGETTRQLINENSVCVNLVKRMCKDLNINNPTEWGIYEIWDYAGTIAVTTTVSPPSRNHPFAATWRTQICPRCRV